MSYYYILDKIKLRHIQIFLLLGVLLFLIVNTITYPVSQINNISHALGDPDAIVNIVYSRRRGAICGLSQSKTFGRSKYIYIGDYTYFNPKKPIIYVASLFQGNMQVFKRLETTFCKGNGDVGNTRLIFDHFRLGLQ